MLSAAIVKCRLPIGLLVAPFNEFNEYLRGYLCQQHISEQTPFCVNPISPGGATCRCFLVPHPVTMAFYLCGPKVFHGGPDTFPFTILRGVPED